MRWAARQRQDFIAQRIRENGKINRKEIMAEFGVNGVTATMDMQRYIHDNPGAIRYNTKTKRYEAIHVDE